MKTQPKCLTQIAWPDELVGTDLKINNWFQDQSNYCLDFHGDPCQSDLVVFSDGNHHMALEQALNGFVEENASIKGVFYITTPPGPILTLLKEGTLRVNNLVLSVKPHVFLSPPHLMQKLQQEGYVKSLHPFVKNQGCVLLVRQGNPKNIKGIDDLFHKDVRLFMSNPDTETVSYQGYMDTILNMRSLFKSDGTNAKEELHKNIIFGEKIHHREAPTLIMEDTADVAVVYYHLGLRYSRIFPQHLEIIPLGGTIEKPDPLPGNVVSQTHLAVVGNGGKWGVKLAEFLLSKRVLDIYQTHGLLPCK